MKAFGCYKDHKEAPNLHILDNECSGEMKTMLKEKQVTFQLVPPHIHRRNAAERATRTYKHHLIANLFTCNKYFHSHKWDRLLPQANITINLLWSAYPNSSLPAYAALFGNHNFNKMPMAPPGTRVIVHEKPSNTKAYADHGTDGCYIRPSLDHYRCFKYYMPAI